MCVDKLGYSTINICYFDVMCGVYDIFNGLIG